jgi:YD repeat-containing protein
LLSVVAVAVLTAPVVATGQIATGIYNYGAFDSKGFDTINIGNLNSHFQIPVFSKQGRGGLNFNHSLVYDSSVWTPVGTSGSQTWQPAPLWGWQADTGAMTGNLSFTTAPYSCGGFTGLIYIQSKFVYTDWNGVIHTFTGAPTPTGSPIIGSHSCFVGPYIYVTDGSFPATDNSGFVLQAHINYYTILAPNGQIILPSYNSGVSATSAADTNGNTITSTGTAFTDTTGNTVLTLSGAGTPSSPRLLTYPTYVSGAASTAAVTVNYTSYYVQTAFGCSGISEYSSSSVNLVSSVVLADGQTYNFTYEATPGYSGKVTGRLASVQLPGGGHIDYSYSGGSNGIVCQDGGTATLTRYLPDDPAGSSWTYTRTPGSGGAADSHTVVADGLSNQAAYDFVNDTADTFRTPYVVGQSQYNGAISGTPALAVATCYNGATTCIAESLTLPISSLAATTTLDGTSMKETAQTFNSSGLITAQANYDYGSGSVGGLLSNTVYAYASLTNGIVNRLSSVTVYGSGSTAIENVTYGYDAGTPIATSGLPNHSSWSGSRGNLTSVRYDTVLGNDAIAAAEYTYDDAGQMLYRTDAAYNVTTYSYDSGTDTYLTGTSFPTTGSVSHSTSSTYDTGSGVKLSDVDMNGNTTNYTYDTMLRPSTISTPASGSQSLTYSLASSSPYAGYSVLHSTGSTITGAVYLDPYGRKLSTDTTDTPTDSLVVYAYDANGNTNSVSNPYRSGDTIAYTTTTYDALARPTVVMDSDGSSERQYAYSGNTTTFTDEAGNKRELVADGLGRTETVWEPDSSNSLTLETDYLYLQNATTGSGSTPTTYQTIVHQKGGSSSSTDWRTRTFTYDMLGRTLSKATPEAGTASYSYVNGSSYCAGNIALVCSTTDANSTVNTYAYDTLSRLTGKTYSGSSIGTSTPSVSYYYDQTSYNGLTIANGNGLKTGMSDGSGSTAWSFDGMGRATAVRKTLNSVTKQANYTFNNDGSVNTVQDFGGTTFTYSYNSAGRPTSIVDGSSNSYASSAVYNAAGKLTSLNHQLTSSGAAYVRSITYNNRLQPSVISATVGGYQFQGLTYGYGTGGTNNGNVLSITNGMDFRRCQTYTYDNLNRVASGGDVSYWWEAYTYDNWGNLYQTAPVSGYDGKNWSVTANANNQLSNLWYDSAGEVTQDQYGNYYNYDAEGRLLSAGSGTYVYDGDGTRVKKTVGSTTTLYWPGVGSLLDESDGSGSTMGKQVRFGGRLVWHEDTSGYGLFLFHDRLGPFV